MAKLVFLLGFIASSFSGHAKVTPLCENTTAIMADFKKMAGDQKTAQELLKPVIEANLIGPGVAVIGKAEAHEIETAKKFAYYFHEKHNLTFVLIASCNGHGTPAFDGLIVDENYVPVANVSLKSGKNPTYKTLSRTLHHAVHKVTEFSALRRWLHQLLLNSEWNNYALPDGRFPNPFRFSDEEHHKTFLNMKETLEFMVSVFAVGSNRPTWVVLDIYNSEYVDKDDFLNSRNLFDEESDHAGLIFAHDGIYTVHKGQLRYQKLDPCAALLTGTND